MSSANQLSVSVIICTRNRSSSLREALKAILALNLKNIGNFEILCVDNGSSDETRSVVEEFSDIAHFRVHYLFEPIAGLSYARNCGLTSASGDLIMFTDDDCLVPADWINVAAQIFADDLFKLVGGRVELFNKGQPSPVTKTSPIRETMASPGQLFGFLHGANMAFGRAVVERIGTFDVRFGAGTQLQSAEDTEFAYRAVTHGVPVIYEPALVIHHDHGRTGKREIYHQLRGYSVGMGALLVKSLIAGRTDLVRPIYWDCRSALRGWRADPKDWRWPLSKTALLTGAVRYLIQASWKRSA